jgi:hypothetical protein
MKTLQILIVLTLAMAAPASGQDSATKSAKYRHWIEAMKEAPRGPFKKLRWFCADGSVLPPKAYACKDHGGGYQHGEWSERTDELRESGYKIANVLAGIEPETLVAEPDFDDLFAQMLIERYLMRADDGWILRKALFYRGALQEEDERAGGRALLGAVASQPRWVDTRFAALRAGASLLPHGEDTASAQKIRQESAALESRDPGFGRLRAKIHGAPEASDADRVREYAASISDEELRTRYEILATDIDDVYQARALADELALIARTIRDPALLAVLRKSEAALRTDSSALGRFRLSADFLVDLRNVMPEIESAASRIALLQLSLRAEQENFSSGTELRDVVATMTRAQQLDILRSGVDAAFGCGLIKAREQSSQHATLDELEQDEVSLDHYLAALRHLGLMPGWGQQNLRFLFFESMKTLAEIEPKAMLFVEDQLRGSPLLLFSQLLDGLSRDANRAAGVRHLIFDENIGAGLKALNPGIAIGTLHTRVDVHRAEELDPEGIYLLPETISELPPIAGIMTAGEGNPLSHVQLLARNLGIPNVTVDESVLAKLRTHDGKRAILAVSPGGLVQLSDAEGNLARRFTGEQTSGHVVIRPELGKLKLNISEFISLDELRATDSGKTVGPKAAKLGELKHAFPEAVAPGVAISFGLFKSEVLDRTYGESGQTVFQWMSASYAELAGMTGEKRAHETEKFRAKLYDTIVNTQQRPEFRERLRKAMVDTFGAEDVGVFVRSDTNVEDLPGFTGAGLNLTLPNVVGFDALQDAINRVWASPFTQRAFAWRQALMEDPQHVYTSILLLRSVAVDKSGVLVTQDLETGDRAVLSVAVNEGLGGAVDGQAAESLRIDTDDGTVRLLATATAIGWRRPAEGGGIETLPASGDDFVLQPAEIDRLVELVDDELPGRFPLILDDSGEPTAADIEFGFKDGQLQLFQIRPFLQSRGAARSTYLIEMDKSLAATAAQTVAMNEVPQD